MLGNFMQAPAAIVNASGWLVLADTDPGVRPNGNGLPGLPQVKEIVGALVVWGLVACVAGMVLGGLVWGAAAWTNNHHIVGKAKAGILVAAVAAIVIAGANTIVGFFGGIGTEIGA